MKRNKRGDLARGITLGSVAGLIIAGLMFAVRAGTQASAAQATTDHDPAHFAKVPTIDEKAKNFFRFFGLNPDIEYLEACSYPSPKGGGLRVSARAKSVEAFHELRWFAYCFSVTPEVQCDLDLRVTCDEIPNGEQLPITATSQWLKSRPQGVWLR